MKIESYKYPKSSFLSIEKDTQLIIDKLLANERFKRLLQYSTPNALTRRNLTIDETYDLLKTHNEQCYDKDDKLIMAGDNPMVIEEVPPRIRFTPKIYVDPIELNYLIVRFSDFSPSLRNPQYRDSTISFDIICHYDLWNLDDMQLRPYKLAGEIDSTINNQHFSGIGTLQFAGAEPIAISGKEYAGITLIYSAVHGEDDKKWNAIDTKPASDNDLEENFNAIFNS